MTEGGEGKREAWRFVVMAICFVVFAAIGIAVLAMLIFGGDFPAPAGK